ncbi:hypothetical protein HPB51_009442 [Rhipicephalus microplus]|uniref:Uncharacterized protein n=1 Tax=Rhipicephalus microplus TaxID=6941 RepID=A0A9J6DZQ7_RHIMP|nr:hypothetical protein HPB51_009442 [Rhipicephalus microplus]
MLSCSGWTHPSKKQRRIFRSPKPPPHSAGPSRGASAPSRDTMVSLNSRCVRGTEWRRHRARLEDVTGSGTQQYHNTRYCRNSPFRSVGDLCGTFPDSDIGDDEVFMTLELPVDSRSSSGSSSAGSGLSPYSANHHLHRINYQQPPEPYSYVQFAKHDYSYPLVETLKSGVARDAGVTVPGSGGAPVTTGQTPTGPGKKGAAAPPLPSKARGGQKRRQCRHCLEEFSEDSNVRGSCEYAPDDVLACINAASCISCAHCMLYHCMADAEGDFSQRPCSCSGSPRDCRRRWAGLALLSLLVPCLWCYLPLRACHRAAVGCGLCGGRHQA